MNIDNDILRRGKFESLLSGEHVVTSAEPHWLSFTGCTIVAAFGVMGVLGAIMSIFNKEAWASIIPGLFTCIILIAVPMLIVHFKKKTNVMVLTNKRLFARTGLLKVKTLDAPLEKVNSVNTKSSFLGSLLGYANLIVSTSSEQFVAKGIADGATMRMAILEQIEIMKETHIDTVAEKNAQAIAKALK